VVYNFCIIGILHNINLDQYLLSCDTPPDLIHFVHQTQSDVALEYDFLNIELNVGKPIWGEFI